MADTTILSRIPFLRRRPSHYHFEPADLQSDSFADHPTNHVPPHCPEPSKLDHPFTKSHQPDLGKLLPDLSENAVKDDNSLWAVTISVAKVILCFVVIMVLSVVWFIILIVLLPWPYERIRQGNIYGRVMASIVLWIIGNPIKIDGAQYANTKAIYLCNHASQLDIFLVMWLAPPRTVGVAKKEIVWYPFYGQLYLLTNHLRLDRSNLTASIRSMREVAKTIVAQNLSILLFPEGTRSANGRLLPFKKGFVHLAIQTKRPIVPIVVTGTHSAWPKKSLHIRPVPIHVTYLPPIETDNWTVDKVDDYANMLHDVYVQHLPESQKPLEEVKNS